MLFSRRFNFLLQFSNPKRHKSRLDQQCRCSSSSSRISAILNGNSHKQNTVIKGWVKSVRKLKNNIFIDVNDGSCSKSLQVVVPKDILEGQVSYGSSVIVHGNLVNNPNNQLELTASKLDIVGECNIEEYPFRPKKSYSNEYIRQYQHLRFRTKGFASLLRVRNEATLALHDFFSKEGYINIHTPILTSNDCEGAGEVFSVIPESTTLLNNMRDPQQLDKDVFFGKSCYLTVSGQLHLEAAARGIGNVYTFGPTFRAENSKSRLHLSEFYMAEAETAYATSIEDITSVAEQLVKHMCTSILNNCPEEVYTCRKSLGESQEPAIKTLEESVSSNFSILSYKEASDILAKNKEKFSAPHIANESFSKEHELFLVKYNSYKPMFVVNWPRSLKPFYMKECSDDSNSVYAFDLLSDTVGELSGGSLREDDPTKLGESLVQNKLENKLDWYLELRRHGNILTGGFGMGFERFLQALLNVSNIKDAIPFPRWPHNCKM